MSKIDPFRIAGRQLKKTSTTPKTYGGFYTSPDPNYARRFGKTYKMDISPDARILYTDKYTTRIPLYQRKELARKYDILAGRDIGAGGAPEYIVLNKRSISNFSPQAVG